MGNVALAVSPWQSATATVILIILMIPTAVYGAWPWIRRVRLRNPIALSPVDGVTPPVATQDEEWAQLTLIPISDATFLDEPVPLDGYAYDGCTFVRCTFVYKGEKPFSLRNFKVEDDWNVKGDSPQLFYFTALLTGLRFLRKDIEVADELQPDAPIAYGEVRRSPESGDSSEER
jgi:hypothetical protein